MFSKYASRLISIAAFLILFGTAFETPASAYAATTIYVDDNAIECPAAAYSDIGLAVAAAPSAGATIIVCAGNYDPFTISSRNKITVKGQDMANRPVVRLPSSVISGTLITVSGSTNIVLDSLIVDGDNFTDGYEASAVMRGIDWNSASGTIQNSRIWNIRDHPISGALAVGIWIRDTSPGAALTKVTIKNNAILEFQSWGVLVMGPNKATITGNQLDGANGETDGLATYGIDLLGDTYGIPSGLVSKNMISNTVIGVELGDSSKVSVTGNTMHGNLTSVRIASNCNYATMASLGSSSHRVIKNVMLETNHGVEIVAEALNDGTHTSCNPQTNSNIVSGNLITARSAVYSEAVLIHTVTSGVAVSFVPAASGNKVTGNTMWGYLDPVKTVGSVSGTVNSGNKMH